MERAQPGRNSDVEKVRREKIRDGEDQRWRKSEERRCRCTKRYRKVAKHCVFPMVCGSGGSKSRLAKAAGAEPAGQMKDKKLHAVAARSTFGRTNTKHTILGPLLEVEMLLQANCQCACLRPQAGV